MSIVIFLASYGILAGATATDFLGASKARNEAFEDILVEGNLNLMAFVAVQGAVVGLALALTATSAFRRKLFWAIALACSVGALLPLSRGAAANLIISCAAVMYACKIGINKKILLGLVVVGVLMVFVPDVVWMRMHFSTGADESGHIDARTKVYTAAVENFPEYALTGVGSGNFWRSWGFQSGFGGLGSHNFFFQVTIYWGLASLLLVLAVIWKAYRCLPKQCGQDGLALCIVGIGVSLLMMMMVRHVLYAKDYSLGLGMLVAAATWIWPKGIVQLRRWQSQPYLRRDRQ
jgi:hypothetical protein